jgi:tetratricopeptide (TPR) repeat protein
MRNFAFIGLVLLVLCSSVSLESRLMAAGGEHRPDSIGQVVDSVAVRLHSADSRQSTDEALQAAIRQTDLVLGWIGRLMTLIGLLVSILGITIAMAGYNLFKTRRETQTAIAEARNETHDEICKIEHQLQERGLSMLQRLEQEARDKLVVNDETLVTAWKAMSEGHPDDYQALVKYGEALFDAGRYDAAGKVFEKATQILPSDHTAFFYLGMCLAEEKDYAAAIDSFDHALSIRGDDPRVLYCRARVCALMGDLSGLLNTLPASLKRDPHYRERARKDAVFAPYLEDREFRAIVGA